MVKYCCWVHKSRKDHKLRASDENTCTDQSTECHSCRLPPEWALAFSLLISGFLVHMLQLKLWFNCKNWNNAEYWTGLTDSPVNVVHLEHLCFFSFSCISLLWVKAQWKDVPNGQDSCCDLDVVIRTTCSCIIYHLRWFTNTVNFRSVKREMLNALLFFAILCL